jgi:CRP-like cAMP-binding protein
VARRVHGERSMFERSSPSDAPSARVLRAPKVEAAIARSVFATMPRKEIDALFEGGHFIEMPARTVVPPSVYASHAALVVDGLSRLYVFAPNGREATVGYRRCGDFLMPVVGDALPPVRIQALTRCQAWLFPLATVNGWLQRDIHFGAALARYFASLHHIGVAEFRFSRFATVRERVARHLVEMAAPDANGRLVAPVSVRELAHSIGSVREVVSREIRRLIRQGWLSPLDDGYVLERPELFYDEFVPLLGHRP